MINWLKQFWCSFNGHGFIRYEIVRTCEFSANVQCNLPMVTVASRCSKCGKITSITTCIDFAYIKEVHH